MKKCLVLILTLMLAFGLSLPVLAAVESDVVTDVTEETILTEASAEETEPLEAEEVSDAAGGGGSGSGGSTTTIYESPFEQGYWDGYSLGYDDGYLQGVEDSAYTLEKLPALEDRTEELDAMISAGTYEEGYEIGYGYGYEYGYREGFYETAYEAGYEIGYALGLDIYRTHGGNDYTNYLKNLPDYPEEEDYADGEAYMFQAGRYDGYMDGYWDGYWEEYEHGTDKALEEAILEAGGQPGIINLMLGGTCLRFDDAVPEIVEGYTMVPLRAVMEQFGATVEGLDRDEVIVRYQDMTITFAIGIRTATVEQGGAREEMVLETVPYIKEGRTFVPLRFVSELLGYEVYWDGDFQTVVLLKKDEVISALDRRFTAINQFLSSQAGRYETTKQVSSTFALTFELLDSIDGDEVVTIAGQWTAYKGEGAMTLEGTLDFTQLGALLENVLGLVITEEDELAVLVTQEQPFRLKITEDGGIYCQLALLDEFFTPGSVTIGDRETWFYLGQSSFSELKRETYTFGNFIYNYTMGSTYRPFYYYNNLMEDAAYFEGILGDELFSQRGGSYDWNFGMEDLLVLLGTDAESYEYWYSGPVYEGADFSMSFSEGGRYNLQGSLRYREYSYGSLYNFEISQKGSRNEESLSILYQERNVMNLILEMKSTMKTVRETPDFGIPEDARIVDLTYVDFNYLLW